MAESRFMRTVTYGGYSKEDVVKQFASLNLRISELKNQLNETKMQLEAYKNGTSVDAALEAALEQERAKLSESQAQNETYEALISGYENQIKDKDNEIKALQQAAAEVSSSLADANAQIAAMQSGDDAAALSTVFIEAQKSANSLKSIAKTEADKIKDDAVALAEGIVNDANNEAAQIVYEAEKNAAIATADAQNNVEQMNVATNNMKAALVEHIDQFSAEISNIRSVLENFSKTGLDELAKAEELLKGTDNTLKSGGVPKFQQAKNYSPKLPPEPPKPAQKAPEKQPQPEKKKGNGLDQLQKMADSIGGKKTGGIDLSALQKQADSLGKKPIKGGIDLSALQKQADALKK